MKRNVEWKNDTVLKTALEGYSRENFKRTEMLSFLEKDFPQYAWSLRSLDRRLGEFKINRVDKDVSVEQLRNAVQEELDGPGRLLGYRAMCNKIRQKHQLKVPRRYVHASNQIERWWRELHERLEKYYKVHLAFLKDQGHYDPDMDIDRAIGFHCFLLHVTGWPITDDELKEVAELSGVLEHEDQYLPVDIENQFKQIIADPKGIKPKDCVDAYLYLKHEYERISE
eukprot:gene706-9204_t